jgi:hypothetical protein
MSRQPFQGLVWRFQRPHHFSTRRPENLSHKQYPTSPRTTIKRSWSFSCIRWPQIWVCLLYHSCRPYQCCRPFFFESPPSKKERIPAGRTSNRLNWNSQHGGGGSPSQAGQSSPTINKVGTVQSEGQPPVSTGLVGASTLKDQGHQSQYSPARSIETHVMSDVQEGKQGSNPTSFFKAGNNRYQTGDHRVQESSAPEGPGGHSQSASAKSRNEDVSRRSFEQSTSHRYSTSSSKVLGAWPISSRSVPEPSNASSISRKLPTLASSQGPELSSISSG